MNFICINENSISAKKEKVDGFFVKKVFSENKPINLNFVKLFYDSSGRMKNIEGQVIHVFRITFDFPDGVKEHWHFSSESKLKSAHEILIKKAVSQYNNITI